MTTQLIIKDQKASLDTEFLSTIGQNEEFLGFSIEEDGHLYANFKASSIKAYQLVLGRPEGKHIKFKDGNKLNVTKENLLLKDSNKVKSPKKRKYLKGVYHYPKNQMRKWKAIISVDGKKVALGYFSTEQEAHNAYLEAAKVYGKIL